MPDGEACRTLPLFVAPLEGEAFDSWLEAIAARHEAPFGEIVRRCEIPHKALHDVWIISQDADSCRRIAAVTGADVASVRAISTAPQYRPTSGLNYAPLQGNSSAWERRTTSRFCPQCLSSNGGRWLSHWRLNWSFACTQHQCLLGDNCPECSRPQRQRPHPWRHVPVPGACAQTRPAAARGSSSMCAADLRTADTPNLRTAHVVVRAQHDIFELLAGRLVSLPVYETSSPVHPRQILNDVKILARWILSDLPRASLRRRVRCGLIDLPGFPPTDGSHRDSRFQPDALRAGIAITTALHLIASPDIGALRRYFRQLIDAPADLGLLSAVAGRQGLTFAVRSALDRALAEVKR